MLSLGETPGCCHLLHESSTMMYFRLLAKESKLNCTYTASPTNEWSERSRLLSCSGCRRWNLDVLSMPMDIDLKPRPEWHVPPPSGHPDEAIGVQLLIRLGRVKVFRADFAQTVFTGDGFHFGKVSVGGIEWPNYVTVVADRRASVEAIPDKAVSSSDCPICGKPRSIPDPDSKLMIQRKDLANRPLVLSESQTALICSAERWEPISREYGFAFAKEKVVLT
jgi:hypothetical protein